MTHSFQNMGLCLNVKVLKIKYMGVFFYKRYLDLSQMLLLWQLTKEATDTMMPGSVRGLGGSSILLTNIRVTIGGGSLCPCAKLLVLFSVVFYLDYINNKPEMFFN